MQVAAPAVVHQPVYQAPPAEYGPPPAEYEVPPQPQPQPQVRQALAIMALYTSRTKYHNLQWGLPPI